VIIDPKAQTYRENYKLLIGSILPRPIAFVSTVSTAGIHNLAPFSFFTGITSQPPTLCFAPNRRPSDGGKKDTLRNIEETREFVVNVVTEEMAVPMNDTATDFPPEVDEFEESGLTPAPSRVVRPPRVEEAPISMECTLYRTIDIGPESAGGGTLVIGEVVLFHVAESILEDGRIDTGELRPIGRLAGAEYTTLGRRFILKRRPLSP
jgi:flavin reductase (DIM6/NTAB) family NADH-FMN oxidoreductase RutF